MEKTARSESRSQGGAISLHRDSTMIAKQNPRIRIVHVFDPEVIKIDPANFKDLVQNLTGNQANRGCHERRRRRKKEVATRPVPAKAEAPIDEGAEAYSHVDGGWEEEGIGNGTWVGGDCGLFGDQYGELDGFIRGLIQCPQAPSTSASEEDLFADSSVSSFCVE